MTSSDDSTFGQDLLDRARDHGMTGDDLAILLRLPLDTIRRLTGPDALRHHSAAVLHRLAEQLDLPWPNWLTTTTAWPQPATPETRPDAHRVHAVLAAAVGNPLRHSEIAHVLGWTIERVRAAAEQLATRARPGGGTRLTTIGDTVTLDLAPRMLDTDARHRLNQLLHAHGLGPQPHVLHLIYELADPHGPRRDWIRQAPDLVDEALAYGLITCEADEKTGEPLDVRLHPDVRFALAVTPLPPQTPESDNAPDPRRRPSH